MRTFEQDEPPQLRIRENATKICLIDRMIAKKFKYIGNPTLHIVYTNYISNHQEILGRLLYDAFSIYFDEELVMNTDHRVINMIRMSPFTPAMYDFLEEFYSLFLLE
jgi:hypothetical protein